MCFPASAALEILFVVLESVVDCFELLAMKTNVAMALQWTTT
jgi:hypothetical protein